MPTTFLNQALHQVDLDLAFGQEFLEPRVLSCHFPQPPDIALGHRAELPTPGVERRLANVAPAANLADGRTTGGSLTHNQHDLLSKSLTESKQSRFFDLLVEDKGVDVQTSAGSLNEREERIR